MFEGQSQRSVASSVQHRHEAKVAAAEERERAAAEIATTAARAARLAMVELAATRAEVEAAAAVDAARAAAAVLEALHASSTEFCSRLLLLRTHEVMACQEASATASLREVPKAGPLYRQRILVPKKISVMALNSTRPERGTSFILYRGAVVMPRCSSKARSLSMRIGDSAPMDSTSSASRYNFSGLVSLEGSCPSSVLSSVPGSSGCCSSAGES
jgi:hypothetical protein